MLIWLTGTRTSGSFQDRSRFLCTGEGLRVSRGTPSVDEVFQTAVQKVNALAATPLREISERLSIDLEQAGSSFLSRSLSGDELARLCAYVCDVVDRLPQNFGERFFFDAAFIGALAGDFAKGLPLSGMIMPRYDQTWGHERLMMPWEKNAQLGHAVHLVHVRGQDRLQDVDLLDYPWMAHEWGHYIMLRHDSSFSHDFQEKLDQIVKSLRLSALAYSGLPRIISQGRTQELIQFWAPSPDHRNWAHELAIDLLSLWTCGPAYLACFEDCLVKERPDPYMVDQNHPPYSVRAKALVEGAEQLGLGAYARGLRKVVAGWDKSKLHPKRDNRFVRLTKPEMIEACTQASFGLCKSLNLAGCSAGRMESLRGSASNFDTADFGVDLLLKARIVYSDKGEAAYNEWEREIVKLLARTVTQ